MDAGPKAGGVADQPWDQDGSTTEALQTLVGLFGESALDDEVMLKRNLDNLLPGPMMRRESHLCVLASRYGVAGDLRSQISDGSSVDAAIRVTTDRLVVETSLDPSACEWVTIAFAGVLGSQVGDAEQLDNPSESSRGTIAYRGGQPWRPG
jgi:hypothetical protein